MILLMKEIFLVYSMTVCCWNSEEYNRERYSWYDLEDVCDDWYMDICHFWSDNYFHLLFDDSIPPYEDNIMEESQDLVMTIGF